MLGTEALWHDCISDTNFPVKLQICFKVIMFGNLCKKDYVSVVCFYKNIKCNDFKKRKKPTPTSVWHTRKIKCNM